MSEYVKAVRSTHLALLGVSGALLSFALSIERKPELDLARAELVELQTAGFDDLRIYPLSTGAPISYLIASIKHLVATEGLTLGKSFKLQLALSSVPDLHIDTLQEALDRLSTLRVFGPNIDALNDGMYPRIDEMKLRGFDTIDSIDIHRTDESNASMKITVSSPRLGTATLTSQIPVIEYVDRSSLDSWFVSWCKAGKEASPSKLIERMGNKTTIFPKLMPYWNVIKDLRAEPARKRLDQEKWLGAQEFEVLGVKITQRLAVLAGPLVMFLIVFFLYCHLRELRLRCSDGQAASLVAEPWVGFFNQRGAKAMTCMTIVIVPALADVLLVVFTEWSLLAYFCLAIASMTMLVGILSYYHVRKISLNCR